MVKKDAVLVRLDPREIEDAVAQAEAGLAAARTAYETQRDATARDSVLFAAKAISQEQWDHSHTAYEAAWSRWHIAQKATDQAHTRLSYTRIAAPNALRDRFHSIANIKRIDVFDFGATPMSTIRAPVDIMISGPDMKTLDRIGRDVEDRLRKTLRGATSISRSWTLDAREIGFIADPEKLALYQISPSAVTEQLQAAVRGVPASVFRIPSQDGLGLWVQLPVSHRRQIEQISDYPILTPHGEIPLSQLGRVTTVYFLKYHLDIV